MEVNNKPTIERGFKKCVSLPRIILLILFSSLLLSGLRFESKSSGEDIKDDSVEKVSQNKEKQDMNVPDTVSTQATSEMVDSYSFLADGVLRVNGAWSRHPVLSVLFYIFVHEGVATTVIALILLGKGREPSRRQMTSAFWVGFLACATTWTVFWGYSRWYMYILVFFGTTFFMNVVNQYTATGRTLMSRVSSGRS